MNNSLLEKYARLLVKTGVNIQTNQILVITSPIECASFTRMVAKIAYEEGAKDVVINWRDELFSKIRYIHAPEEAFEEFPEWKKEFHNHYVKEGAAFLRIAASDPELMKDVNPERIAKENKVAGSALKEYRESLMSNKNVWCIASVPTKAWAKKVFPDLSEDEAVEKLWEAILKAVRVDTEDPVAAWEKHKNSLKKSMDFLNSNKFKYLHFKNSLGTDLRIELPEKHMWVGGSDFTPEGVEFIANMPTEEVFTAPKKTGVNGTVVSSKPLNHNGNLVENFSITFKDGKIVDFSAEKGYDTLKKLIETDEGSSYLGEVALVPYDSPISKSNILFYNTLFDENASCHLAIGKAYPVCIENSENMSEEELKELGVNDSLVHADFMIGTKDLEIIGITAEGEEIPIFKNGNFAY
ncbi:aminopeptidase [Thermohalobacter berrensis]|uniref:Peptidase M29 n=1 Tax=Thermohalobacter berrensis TaxID=99594 RepID=A0A419SWB5_9FIRM|nr:aminopeptidase [Thermohalobacter berrensis]RKD29500.1 peptidase M29 [Thermohalobacter berrensis]